MKIWIPIVAVLAVTCGIGCGAKTQAPAVAEVSETPARPVASIEPKAAEIAPATPTVAAQRKPSEMPDGPVVEGDQFAKEKEWGGNRVEVHARMERLREFKLVVTKRSGEHLQGVFYFPQLDAGGPNPTYAVEGTAPVSGDGEVRFSTLGERRHKEIFVEGQIEDGEMWLVYNGKMASAGEVYGVGMVKPKGAAIARAPGRPRPRERTSPPGARQEALGKLQDSEYYTAAHELAKNEKESLVAKKVVWSKEAANLTPIELAQALREKFPRTLDERTRFSIYNARLRTLNEENMTPEERLAKQELSLYLFSVIFPGGDAGTPEDSWAKKERDKQRNDEALYESEKRAAEAKSSAQQK